ncbi:MAG: 30S ribosomal protein S20 [Dehalococcoidia bacterium]|nr:30S ribosomal protein S20 [Dehalococcoidia bacterium]
MANSPQARKRVRQTIKRTEQNKPFRTRALRAVRDARVAIANGDDDAQALVRLAQQELDRAARRNIIHPNAASRRVSRLNQQLKASATA